MNFSDDVIDQLATALSGVAPVLRDHRTLAENDAPPRFVIVPVSIDDADPSDVPDDQAPPMRWDTHRTEVHCWANSKRGCEQMRRAIIKACRTAFLGLPRVEIASATWSPDSYGTAGFVLVVRLGFKLPLTDCTLPSVAGDPETTVVDAPFDTVTITSTGLQGLPDTASGDGNIDLAGEP